MAKKRKRKSEGGGTSKSAPQSAGSPAAGSAASQGRAARAERATPQRGDTPRRRSTPNLPVLALSAVGAVIGGYLAFTSWSEAGPVLCGEGSACDLVQESRWGTFLALPTAFWGLLTYLAIGHVAYRVRAAERHWKWLWTLSLVGLAYSIYLTVISVTVIEATCFYCITSLAVMAAIFTVVALQKPRDLTPFAWAPWVGQTAVLAAVVVGAMHLHYSGIFDPAAGPEEPYLQAVATHVASTDAVFYGAYW